MPTIEDLQLQVEEIQRRNKRVELDKAWETSYVRKFLILFFTYFIVTLFFVIANLPNPFVNAIVPTLGFFLSTLTMPLFKGWWIRHQYKK